MLDNTTVEYDDKFNINAATVHKIISIIKNELKFSISFLQINFVSSQYIEKLNKQYLEHEGSTDIITFNYSGDNSILDGECFICVDVADDNSRRFEVSIQNELIRLITHGILHMVGFDDLEENDRLKMKQKENEIVNKFENYSDEVISGYDK